MTTDEELELTKEINHVRTYKIEVRHFKDGDWSEFYTMDETVEV